MEKRITLFLDLDGVLITTRPWQQDVLGEDGYSLFKVKLVANLNKLLKKGRFEILLSSSRRTALPLDKFNRIFENRGIRDKITDYTPISFEKRSRKQELEEYITQNRIKNFLILDDDKSLNGLDKKLKTKLVLTKYMLGFNNEKLEEAIKKVSCQMVEHA